jgi:tRNA nucleotidyltransferase (CCA-adding enzyme)
LASLLWRSWLKNRLLDCFKSDFDFEWKIRAKQAIFLLQNIFVLHCTRHSLFTEIHSIIGNLLKTFLVGGAVRDKLLKQRPRERDWLVVGASPEEMLALGFRPVGKDFPVFLHPDTHEEYALARTERKIARGYGGFSFYTGKDVSIEDDLLRRDLTINAMAEDELGNLIDPYHGKADLEAKILRHVSPAFAEDPVRVLRLARTAAELKQHGFTVAEETIALVKHMAASGELEALVPERVIRELLRALDSQHPATFFEILREGNALKVIFPEVDALFGVPQRAEYHPEVDTGIHLLLCLQQCVKLQANSTTRFAVLCHDFGKAITPKHILPKHIGHETNGLPVVESFCERLRVPNDLKKLALRVTEHHLLTHRIFELRASTILKLFKNLSAFQQKQNLLNFLTACEADAKGRTGFETQDFPQRDYLLTLFDAAISVGSDEVDADRFQHAEFGKQLDQLRIKKIEQTKRTLLKNHEKKT